MHGNKKEPISWPAVCPTTPSAITPINRSGKAKRVKRTSRTTSPSTPQHLLLTLWSTGQRRSGPQIRASSPQVALRRNQRPLAPSCTSYLHVYMYTSHHFYHFMLSSHTTFHHCIVPCIITIKNRLGNISLYVFLPPMQQDDVPERLPSYQKRSVRMRLQREWLEFYSCRYDEFSKNDHRCHLIEVLEIGSSEVQESSGMSTPFVKNSAVLYNSVQNSIAEQ